MAFHSTNRTFTLNTTTTSAYMSFPAMTSTFPAVGIARYLISNPSTVVQYFAVGADNTLVLTAPSGVSNAAAVETLGTPILPGQQALYEHPITGSATPFFYGLASSGTAQIIVTYGSGD